MAAMFCTCWIYVPIRRRRTGQRQLAQSQADLDFAQKQVALLQAQANLAASQANLVKAQQDYDRLVPLVKDDAAAKQELDAAVAALEAKANVRRPSECRSGPAFKHARKSRLTSGQIGCPAGRPADSGAQFGVRHHSRAHQRSDWRYAGTRRRLGQRQLGSSRLPPLFRWTPYGCASRFPNRISRL